MHGTSIVVPTFNERGNLPELVERIDSILRSKEYDYEIVVVDDDSPDGTWEVATKYSENYPIKVIRRREERGLATAALRGIKESKHDFVAVMDADLQHPPEKIPELISELENGADIAIGSRYVEGGSEGDFGILRKAISRGADFLARTIFRKVRKVNDIQSGFFAVRKEIIRPSDLDPKGYKILLEILIKANYERVSEVGYEFGDRKAGESKLGFGAVKNYLRHLISLSWRTGEIFRFLKFCVVGAAGVIVNLTTLYLLTTSGLFYLASGAVGIEMGLLTNFFLNKAWTFRDRGVEGLKPILNALGRDHLVRSGGALLNILLLWILTDFLGLYYLLSQLIGIGIATSWNFMGNKWWTWNT